MAEIDLYDYDHVYFKSPTPYLVSICTDSCFTRLCVLAFQAKSDANPPLCNYFKLA